MTIFSYIRAALISEFWTLTDLNEWIINVLTASNKYHYELYDLLYVKDFEKVMEILSHLAALEDYTKYNEISIPYVVLGYYYWRYILGQIELRKCVILCGEYADQVGTNLDCSEFYSLIKEIDDSVVKDNMRVLCEDLFVEAKRQYKLIHEFC
ncbi:MAG: hypothetical protein J5999_09875 [Oscillospiraceae bacterium]|nr:hypothetical protein [Oscillospiraceae bacterium]